MTEIIMIPVVSSNVDSIGYDKNTNILRIKFLNGSIYEYKNVPLIEYMQLKNATSMGSYVNRNIAYNYSYTKIA